MHFAWTGLLAILTVSPTLADDGGTALVFGGTGRLGAPIVRLLSEAGYPVTVFARATSDRGRLEGLDVEYLVGDLTDPASVVAAAGGRQFRYVIDASGRGRNRDPFYATAMQGILAAVADSNVQQFILHGSVGAGDNMKQFPDVGFGRMSVALQAKGEAEELLRNSGIDYTIIRNGLVKPDGTPASGTASLTEDDTVLSAVSRLDLAALTMWCLDNSDCINKTFHAVGD